MEAAILAGGLGTRLRSVVSDVPKCMAPVGGRPFLYYLLEQLRGYEVTRVILSVGYKREVIKDWISAHASDYPFEFVFAEEEQPLGTGGGIRMAASFAYSSELIVLNGDTFFDADLNALRHALHSAAASVAVALKPMTDFDRYGTAELSGDGTVTAFHEKQPKRQGLVNGGIYALDLSSDIFSGMPEKFSFETEVLDAQCRRGKVAGLVQDGYFIDIGIPEDYSRADAAPRLLSCRYGLSRALRSLDGFDTLLLDRDGVINRLIPGDYVKDYSEFEWLPGVRGALKSAASVFRHIFIVTNQRGVGRGVMSREALDAVHRSMLSEILACGGRIDGIYCCTAASDDDPRRKPHRGMFDEILAEHPEVNPAGCIMLGDSESDSAFARNCGIAFRFIEN